MPKAKQIIGDGEYRIGQIDDAEAANPGGFKPFYVKAEKLAARLAEQG